MQTVYRLGHKSTGESLPLHWCYAEPVGDDGEDCRQPGFQAWADPIEMIAVAAGIATSDGRYDAADYPKIFVVVANSTYSGGEWEAVSPGAVKSVRVHDTQAVLAWCLAQAKEVYEGADRAVLCDWLQTEGVRALPSYLKRAGHKTQVTWVETLPV